jgi:HK97 gp10 family phage protein
MATKFEVTGLKETLQVFQDLQNDIGDKQARSKVLIPAVKEAMKPVLSMAKGLAPKDSGMLASSLRIVGRRPTNADKKSKYITGKDNVIAIVTSRPIPRKLKKQMFAEHGHLYKGRGKDNSEFNEARKDFYASHNQLYDARAMFNEFGTAKMPANPFMRVSLENQAFTVTSKLGEILKQKIEQYRSKAK